MGIKGIVYLALLGLGGCNPLHNDFNNYRIDSVDSMPYISELRIIESTPKTFPIRDDFQYIFERNKNVENSDKKNLELRLHNDPSDTFIPKKQKLVAPPSRIKLT